MKQLSPTISLYILQPIAKGFGVFYLVLLPLFYSSKLITATEVGYIGAMQIAFLVLGATAVALWLHNFKTRALLVFSSFISLTSLLLLLFSITQRDITLMLFSFALNGIVVGISTSGTNAIATHATKKGNRYGAMANLAIFNDIVRVAFPLVVTAAVLAGKMTNAVYVIFIISLIFLFVSYKSPDFESKVQTNETSNNEPITKNKSFLFFLLIEFLDSFGSSQLFVYLPLLFLAKGYAIQNSFLTQSLIFLGYMAGRVFISYLAKKVNGSMAIAIAEIGMAISILLLLLLKNMYCIYALSFILGIFTRGTSPVIKALAFDSLSINQTKKGSAFHIVAGDTGNGLAQLIFGLMFTYLGANSPFIASIIIVMLVTILCLYNFSKFDFMKFTEISR